MSSATAAASTIEEKITNSQLFDHKRRMLFPSQRMSRSKKGTVLKLAFKRLGKPSEVADVVAYLCSEEASWVTGEELLVAGGFMYR